MSGDPTTIVDHASSVLDTHSASMPLALGVGGFIFVVCVIGGQLTWRNMRRLLRRSFFEHTSCVGEPTLVGVSAGLLFGISIGFGIFYGLEPQALYQVEAISAIATILSLLTCGACCFGWLCVLNLDCGIDGTRSWEVLVLCLVPCCCSMTSAIGVGAALGYGLRSRMSTKANAEIQFTQTSIAIGAVIAILLALCLGFCLFNMTRLRRQHRNLYQRRDVLQAIPQDPEQAHALWLREAKMAVVMGLHRKVGEKSVLYKQLMQGEIAEPRVLGHVFELLGYDPINLENNHYPADDASLQSQRRPVYTRPVALIRAAANVAGLPLPPSLANIGDDNDATANEADYELQSLAHHGDGDHGDAGGNGGLHYRGSSQMGTFGPSAGISGPMMASLTSSGNGGHISGIAGPGLGPGWNLPMVHMDDNKYGTGASTGGNDARRGSVDYMFHVRDDDKYGGGETKRGVTSPSSAVPILAPPPGDVHTIDMTNNYNNNGNNYNSNTGGMLLAGVGGPAFTNLLMSSTTPPVPMNSISITIHDQKEIKRSTSSASIPPPPEPSPAFPPRVSPSAKFRAANAAAAAAVVRMPLPHISSSLLTRNTSSSAVDGSHNELEEPEETFDDSSLVSSSSSSQILPPLLASSSMSSTGNDTSNSPNTNITSSLTSSGGNTAITSTPTAPLSSSASSHHLRLHSATDVTTAITVPRSRSDSSSLPMLRIVPLAVTSSGNDSPSPETPSTADSSNGHIGTPLSASAASVASSSRGSFSSVPLVAIAERNEQQQNNSNIGDRTSPSSSWQ